MKAGGVNDARDGLRAAAGAPGAPGAHGAPEAPEAPGAHGAASAQTICQPHRISGHPRPHGPSPGFVAGAASGRRRRNTRQATGDAHSCDSGRMFRDGWQERVAPRIARSARTGVRAAPTDRLPSDDHTKERRATGSSQSPSSTLGLGSVDRAFPCAAIPWRPRRRRTGARAHLDAHWTPRVR